MAAMTTALTEFSDNGNSRTYTFTGHTASKPRLVIQTRRVPTGAASIAEDTIKVVYATTDAATSEILDSKIVFEGKLRRPINGLAADMTAALVVIRDIIAGDEYTNTVDTQEWLS